MSKITSVLRNVAKSELISETPILPQIAVNAAKIADANANTLQSALIGRSVDPAHEVRSFDDGIDFCSRHESEPFRRLLAVAGRTLRALTFMWCCVQRLALPSICSARSNSCGATAAPEAAAFSST